MFLVPSQSKQEMDLICYQCSLTFFLGLELVLILPGFFLAYSVSLALIFQILLLADVFLYPFCESISQVSVPLWFHIIRIISCVTKCLYVIAGFAVLVLCLGSRQANIDYIVLSILLLVEIFCLGMLPVNDGMESQFPMP